MRGEPMALGAISKLYAAALAHEDWSAVLGEVRESLAVIPGSVPNMLAPPKGCRFSPRSSSITAGRRFQSIC